MSRFDELKQEISRLPLTEQAFLIAELERHIAEELGYEDMNIGIAEKNLAEYRAGKLPASPWEEVKQRLFDGRK